MPLPLLGGGTKRPGVPRLGWLQPPHLSLAPPCGYVDRNLELGWTRGKDGFRYYVTRSCLLNSTLFVSPSTHIFLINISTCLISCR